MVAIEKFEETCLGSGRAFGTAEGDSADFFVDAFKIQIQILQIEAETFADRGQLGGLEVGETQHRHIFVFIAECGELFDQFEQFFAENFQTFPHLDKFGIIGHKAACRPQVDDGHGIGTLFAENSDMAHHIVTAFFFHDGDFLKIDIIEVCFHLGDLGICDLQSEFFFALGKHDPKSAPCGVFELGGPDETHLFSGIAVGQRILINTVIHLKIS